MRKYLLLIFIILSGTANATLYIFKLDYGDFRIDDKLNVVGYKQILYNISNIHEDNDGATLVYCNKVKIKKLFVIFFQDGNRMLGEYNPTEIFQRRGVGAYNKRELIANLYTGIDNFIQENKLSGDIGNSFRSSANKMIEGIKNGTITMNGDGSLSDSTGSLQSNGKNEFDWLGRLKNNTNNINNLAAGYVGKIINNMNFNNDEWEIAESPMTIHNIDKKE